MSQTTREQESTGTTISRSGRDGGTRVPVKQERIGALMDRVRRVHDRITERAFEVFQQNGSRSGTELDDWIAAEQALVWQPSLDISETDGTYTIRAAVPGMAPENLEVTTTSDQVVISGERQHSQEETRGRVHVSEFSAGSLFRRVHYPGPVDPSGVRATFRNGILEITAPAAPEPEQEQGDGPQAIEVIRA